ncbi:CRISPR-associated endoribonuclease Cas6 [bacterium]|nr:CRISPR-associated endoribonuclease Cas6 [bacterium]
MRLMVVFSTPREILLPWNYLDWLRGLIYRLIGAKSQNFASWLHQEGVSLKNKRYKPFNFSLLYPSNKKAIKKGLLVKGEIKWFISSPVQLICQLLAEQLLHFPSIKLGPHEVEILQVLSISNPSFPQTSHFSTLSPISVSTGFKQGEKFLKRYLSPDEELFPKLLKDNLLNKAEAFWLPPGELDIEVKPPFRSRLFKIKGIDVRGWDMELIIRGDNHLINLAYDVGLGEHNACGFGMLSFKQDLPGGESLANHHPIL